MYFEIPLISITHHMTSVLRGSIDLSSFGGQDESNLQKFRLAANHFLHSTYDMIECVFFAELAYQKNNLNKALSLLQDVLSKLPAYHNPEINFLVSAQLCFVYNAQHKKDALNAALSELQSIVERHQQLNLMPNFDSIAAKLKMCDYDSEAAIQWLISSKQPKDLSFFQLQLHFTRAKALILTKNYHEAHSFLLRLQRLCTDYHRTLDLVEVYILKSICLKILKMTNESINDMYRAVLISQKHGFVRVFLDEPDCLAVLEMVSSKHSKNQLPALNSNFLQKLISVLRIYKSSRKNFTKKTFVKLSKKQKIMLQLLANGLTYDQICAATGLKITTIRTHISNLYNKLEVNNKSMAIIKAKDLGLLEP